MTVGGGSLGDMRTGAMRSGDARSGAVAAGLFASAFSPVLVALALVTTPFASVWANSALIIACAAPASLVGISLRSARRIQETQLRFARVRRVDRDVLTFMSSFLLPIATAFFAVDVAKWAATGVLLALLMIVYVRGQMFHLNPVLAMIGFRVFEVESSDWVLVTVLSRRRSLPPGGTLSAVRFSDELFVDFGSV